MPAKKKQTNENLEGTIIEIIPEKKTNKKYSIASYANNGILIMKPNALRSPSAKPLKINDLRILFYAMHKIQLNEKSVSFTKQELDESFGVDFGSYKEIKNYMADLRTFGVDIEDESLNRVIMINAFKILEYNNGLFNFKFNEEFLPTLTNQKQFLKFGMKSIEKFKSKYTIYLYDYLKTELYASFKIKKDISVNEFKEIFKLKPTAYKGRNSNFKSRVWEPALKEINEYTDYKIEIITHGRGDNLTFTILRLENETLSSTRQSVVMPPELFDCKLGKDCIDAGCENCMRINKCPLKISDAVIKTNMCDKVDVSLPELRNFMNYVFWNNSNYSLKNRIRYKTATPLELEYRKLALEEGRWMFDLLHQNKDDVEFDEEQYLEEDQRIATKM